HNPGFIPQDRLPDGSLSPLEGSHPTVAYSAAGVPPWATFDTATAVLKGTPPFGAAGTYQVTFTASDGSGANQSATVTVPIVVLKHHATPQFTVIPNLTLDPGQAVDVPVHATVASADPLVLAASGLTGYPLPAFAGFTDHGDGTGVLHLTPGAGDGGIY